MSRNNPIVFWVIRNTETDSVTTLHGEKVTLGQYDVPVYLEYADNSGYFEEGYDPNTFCNSEAPRRLGEVIFDSRIEKVRCEKRCADPEAEPTADICANLRRDIQEVDEPEYELKGNLWSFNPEYGIWSKPT